jgi:hypothetical protein
MHLSDVCTRRAIDEPPVAAITEYSNDDVTRSQGTCHLDSSYTVDCCRGADEQAVSPQEVLCLWQGKEHRPDDIP